MNRLSRNVPRRGEEARDGKQTIDGQVRNIGSDT